MDTFTQKVTEIVEQCIPEQTRHINHKHLRREPWFTLSLKRSIEKNKRLYNKSLKCPSRLIAYKTYKSTLRKIIRKGSNQPFTRTNVKNSKHKRRNYGD